MSDDIKELVKRLDEQWDRRRIGDSPFGEMSCLLADAADALEALVAERDRLKAALQEIADMLNRGPDSSQNWDVKSIYDIAREALEAKGTHGSPELDEDAQKLAAMGQDPGATFAADPAPAVCEWTPDDFGRVRYWQPSCSRSALGAGADEKGNCYICGKLIKFTEAKE